MSGVSETVRGMREDASGIFTPRTGIVSASNGRSTGHEVDCIRDAEDFAAHVDYCHWNPVKHGYVARSEDWAWSSVHRERVRVRGAWGK